MGTAHDFDDILKQELNIHAAWLPVTNTFKMGDYGLISDGVLVKIGNIRDDFGVSFTQAPGPAIKLNFTSKGTSMIRIAGSATVPQFPDSDIEAKLSVEFKHERSFLLKAILTLVEMEALNAVANKLNNVPQWEKKFRVVSALYRSKDCTVISSKAAGSKIELSGKAKALKQFDFGSASADVQASVKQEIGIDILGKDGVIGLGMFKLGWWNPVKTLNPDEKIPIETIKDWPHNLPDDV